MKPKPRILPLTSDQWSMPLRAMLKVMPGGTTRPMNIFTTLSRHSALFRGWLVFAAHLLKGRLSARDRELTILRTAWHCDCAYERVHHRKLARKAGIDQAAFDATAQASLDSFSSWSTKDRCLLRAVDELNTTGTLSDDVWESLSKEYADERDRIELVMLVGHYRMVAMTLNTLRIAVEEDEEAAASHSPMAV